jgi:protein arginine N-methyltransferase 1
MATVDRDPQLPAALIPIHYHHNMLNDAVRMHAFREAITLAVRPGMRVVDLGGGTGVLSWFAARAGATRVWCVEQLPLLAATAERLLAANPGGERVTVVHGAAEDFVPPEPVDVVLCEMLHVGLLRERQVDVIAAFKANYLAAFGPPLPAFVPEATLQAVQLVQQDHEFHGYHAAVPMFHDPSAPDVRTVGLAAPALFQTVVYADDLPDRCTLDAALLIDTPGRLNAVRFVTKNVLTVSVDERRAVEWFMSYLVLPVAGPFAVEPGDGVCLSFGYRPGDELAVLEESLCVGRAAPGAGSSR